MNKPQKIEVRYNGGDINIELDKLIEGFIKQLGYKWWASGVDTDGKLSERWRDICFDKEDKK